MSFFEDPRKAGLAFMIVGIISVIGGIIAVILGAMQYRAGDYLWTYGAAVAAIGTIIYGALYFGYGSRVRGGAISAKIDILATFVRLVGIGTIVTGIFSAIGTAVDGGDLGTSIVAAIISIIVGLIILFIGSKINDGKKTIGDKIIWIILLIAFVLCIIFAILEIITIIGIITGICDLIIYIFMLLLLLDPAVKSEMNM